MKYFQICTLNQPDSCLFLYFFVQSKSKTWAFINLFWPPGGASPLLSWPTAVGITGYNRATKMHCFPSYVYKCVCQQHSELLYSDLTSKITAHLQQVSTQLQVGKPKDRLTAKWKYTELNCVLYWQASPPENLIENFNVALTQYLASLQCIVPVFIYLVGIICILCNHRKKKASFSCFKLFSFQYFQNKFYIESKLNRDLKEDLMKLFADNVAEEHLSKLMREPSHCLNLSSFLFSFNWSLQWCKSVIWQPLIVLVVPLK